MTVLLPPSFKGRGAGGVRFSPCVTYPTDAAGNPVYSTLTSDHNHTLVAHNPEGGFTDGRQTSPGNGTSHRQAHRPAQDAARRRAHPAGFDGVSGPDRSQRPSQDRKSTRLN